jgi:AcrR family transcriptional regulator
MIVASALVVNTRKRGERAPERCILARARPSDPPAISRRAGEDESLRRHTRFRSHSPTRTTARRLLDAAVRVLDQHGFSGLTFERIAQEAGENAALIRYHFGSKSGLVRDLVDVVLFARLSS